MSQPVHADSPWRPLPPGRGLAAKPVTVDAWSVYLRAQRYTPAEVQVVVPDLRAVVAAAVRARPEAEAWQVVQGAVVGWLELRPPASVLELSALPPRYLGPVAMGERLAPLAGGELVDVMTGERWTRAETPAPALLVVAAALYNAVGLAAPAWRLVDLNGERAAVALVWRHWHPLERRDPLLEQVERGSPCDVWLARTGGEVLRRLNPIEGLPAVLRADVSSCLRGRGWGVRLDWRGELVHRDMLGRIAAVGDDLLQRAVDLGDLGRVDAAELLGTLIARRAILRSEHSRLGG